jgi:hypothetical protein
LWDDDVMEVAEEAMCENVLVQYIWFCSHVTDHWYFLLTIYKNGNLRDQQER